MLLRELSKQHDTLDIAPYGGIPLPMIQKWMNFHFSICLDLFGQETSTNAANFYSMGLKGRYLETKIDDDHALGNDMFHVPELRGDNVIMAEAPALTAVSAGASAIMTLSPLSSGTWNISLPRA